jgi:hypothetical protein
MPIQNVALVNKANQFIDLAGADNIVSLKDNGQVGTRSSVWNRVISWFSTSKTREKNQRTAEAFKESLLGAASEFDYKRGNEAYHSKDIFYHFAGAYTSTRREVLQSVFDSGILNEELAGAKPLTGRKIQEVITRINSQASDHIVQKRNDLFRRVEEGLGVYKESEAKFIEGNYDREKLEGINQFAYDTAVADFRFAEDDFRAVITNLRQDFETSIELGDTEAAKHILGEITKAGRLQSEVDLFTAEDKYHNQFKNQVANLEQRFNKLAPHIEAIQFNFANLTQEQLKARDDLNQIAAEAKELGKKTYRAVTNAKDHLAGNLLDEEQYGKWQAIFNRAEQIDDTVSRIYSAADVAVLKRGHKDGGKPQPRVRNEETHISPTAIVTKEEISSLEAEIARRADAAVNGGANLNAKKGILKNRVSQSALDQVKQGKSVSVSRTLNVSYAGNDKEARLSRESHEPTKTANDDISEIDEPNDLTGIYDPKTRTLRRDTFSNLGVKERVSQSQQQKTANLAKALETGTQERNLIEFQSQLAKAKEAANTYIEGSDQYDPLKFVNIANKRKVDLAKVTPEQKQYFSTLLSLRLADLATDNDGKEFTADEIESIAGKALRYAATLSPAEIAASQARFDDLKNAGLTLLTSASGQELRAISQTPKNISIALSEYLLKSNTEAVSKDLLLGGSSEFGAQDAALIQRISINLALHDLRADARQLLFSDIAANNSPFRSGYLAAAALINNPATREDLGAISASNELFTAFSNLVLQVGLSAGADVSDLNNFIGAFNNVSDRIQYQDIGNGTVNAEALQFAGLDSDQATKDLFNVLDGYVGVRGEQIAANQLEEEARFQRQMEAERAAGNNPVN